MRYEEELHLAIQAVRDGFSLASLAQGDLTGPCTTGSLEVCIKDDASPVTAADFAVQAVVNDTLAEGSDCPIMAEESAGRLRGDPPLLERVRGLASRFRAGLLDPDRLVDAVDLGGHPGGDGRFWVLDPIDGTAGFVAGRSWSVALALVDSGRPVVGVLGCSGMPDGDALFYTAQGIGAAREPLDGSSGPSAVRVSSGCEYAICESYEAGHAARAAETRLSAMFPAGQPDAADGRTGEVRLCRQRHRCGIRAAVAPKGPATVHMGPRGRDRAGGGGRGDRHRHDGGAARLFGWQIAPGDGILATNGVVHGRALEALGGWWG